MCIIRNLQTYIKQEHNRLSKANATKFTYVEKWLSNKESYHKLSNHLWKTMHTTDIQIMQLFKFWFAEYMGNHWENLF